MSVYVCVTSMYCIATGFIVQICVFVFYDIVAKLFVGLWTYCPIFCQSLEKMKSGNGTYIVKHI